jgi:hypothetical protein
MDRGPLSYTELYSIVTAARGAEGGIHRSEGLKTDYGLSECRAAGGMAVERRPSRMAWRRVKGYSDCISL